MPVIVNPLLRIQSPCCIGLHKIWFQRKCFVSDNHEWDGSFCPVHLERCCWDIEFSLLQQLRDMGYLVHSSVTNPAILTAIYNSEAWIRVTQCHEHYAGESFVAVEHRSAVGWVHKSNVFAIYGSDNERIIPQITKPCSYLEPFIFRWSFQLQWLQYVSHRIWHVLKTCLLMDRWDMWNGTLMEEKEAPVARYLKKKNERNEDTTRYFVWASKIIRKCFFWGVFTCKRKYFDI